MADHSLRRLTLSSLRRYASGGIVNEDDPTLWHGPIHPGNAGTITLDPDTISREMLGQPQLQVKPRRSYTPAAAPPAAPAPAPQQDTRIDPNLDLRLGFQSGLAGIGQMLTKPAEDIYGVHGVPLSQAVTQSLAPDQEQLAARSTPLSRTMQFAGRLPTDVARYGLATTAAGGNPILGAAAADALGADTPQEAARQGLESGVAAAIGERAIPNLIEQAPEAIRGAVSALPSREELQAAQDAANARLRASGVYGTAMPMNQAFNPATLRDVAISTGAQLGGGLYTVGEQAAARAGLVKKWITDMRNQGLTPEEQDRFAQARQSSPELDQVGDLVLPLEARQIIKSPDAVTRMLRVIPDSAKMAAAAKMGVSKLGWYRGSSQALTDVFGDDAPRFAQLLASMSPQTSVESNLQNALNTWKNWVAEGRPTDPAAIKRIMGRSVQGGTEKSAMDAWVHNSVRSLSADDPQSVVLSGPKVDSFYHNLRDDVFRVTNDAWMANAYGIAQDAFGGSGVNLLAGNPGMTPIYAGASARLRDAALQAGMLPSQGQETIWSAAMQLYELARKNGMHPREVLERGMLTPQVIRGAPDFSTLLKDPKYARILEDAGYGPQLSAMQPFQFPETSVPMTTAEQEQFGKIADILGETARMRGDVSAATKFSLPKGVTQPPQAYGSIQVEAQPGVKSGHFPETAALPYGSKGTYASGAFSGLQDLRAQPSLLSGSEIPRAPTVSVVGAYTPEGSSTAEVNPARSQSFTAPLQWRSQGPRVEPQFMANVRGPAAVQNVMLAQEGTGIPVMTPNEQGANLSIRLPNKPKITPDEMQALQQAYPKWAFAHTGTRLHALNINDEPLTKEMADNMQARVRGTSAERADNLGDYLDFARNWDQAPGSGAVTGQMMDYVNRMTPQARAALDEEMRDSAGRVLDFYQQKMRTQGWTPRQDLLNLLETMRDKGVRGVRQGLKNGAFLPGLAGAFLAPHLLQRNTDQSGE